MDPLCDARTNTNVRFRRLAGTQTDDFRDLKMRASAKRCRCSVCSGLITGLGLAFFDANFCAYRIIVSR